MIDADPSAPGGIAAVYRNLVADDARTKQVAGDVSDALRRGWHCLVLTKWIAHLDRLAVVLRKRGWDPVILRDGMGAKTRAAALARLHPQPGAPPPLVVATGPYIGEGFDCPALDTLFLAAPVGYKGSIVQWAGRILRAHPGRPPRRSTTITTSAHPCSPRAWPGAPPGLYGPRLPRSPPGRFYAPSSAVAAAVTAVQAEAAMAGVPWEGSSWPQFT